MKKVITYVANDETEFDTEEECLAYENRFDALLDASKVEFFNEDFTRNTNIDITSKDSIYWKSFYILLKNEDIIDVVLEAFNDAGVYGPFDIFDGQDVPTGLYYYHGPKDDYWSYFDDTYKDFVKIIRNLDYKPRK